MKFAIIAAGEGSRLAQEGVPVPKPLVKINGECLIDRLIRIFMDNDAEEIVVISRAPEGEDSQMQRVTDHLHHISVNGLNGRQIPLRHIVKATPSSMHSFYELSRFLTDAPFVLTTVDTIFREDEFAEYIDAFRNADADGMMGVTDYIDDEKPLYVATKENTDARPTITGFLDKDEEGKCRYISGGIYGLRPVAIDTLNKCIASGQSRMRNFQRALITDGLNLEAHVFTKVLDIDHATDIKKAEDFLNFASPLRGTEGVSASPLRGTEGVLIYREPHFSPASVEKDKAIMDAVADLLVAEGKKVKRIKAEEVTAEDIADAAFIFNMGRDEALLQMLTWYEEQGGRVVNSPSGIRLCCHRAELDALLRNEGIAVPPQDGADGVWIKRGDGPAEVQDDVVLCHGKEEEQAAIERMRQRGVTSWVRQAHIKGDLLKFYGVAGTGFFTYSYPSESGRSKFGLEEHNGKPQHYKFDERLLVDEAEKIAMLTGVLAYGGDAVVTEDGRFYIIDFNDWPTFSTCREQAARAIIAPPQPIGFTSLTVSGCKHKSPYGRRPLRRSPVGRERLSSHTLKIYE